MSAARVCGRRETSGEGKQCTRRGGRHFEEANSGGKFSFPWVFGVARKYREAKRVKGGNETWTWLSSQVDDVYRSRKKILQVVMATSLDSCSFFLYYIQQECGFLPPEFAISIPFRRINSELKESFRDQVFM